MSHRTAAVLIQVRRLLETQPTRDLDDAHLLELFRLRSDEDAFAELVRRHGPLVLGVCRRVLRDVHDAEDVFQATFLVFARKADSIRRREALASWLYRVAYRLSLKCRAGTQRRREREQPFLEVEQAAGNEVIQRELRAVLDEELQRLPEKQRVPLLLCYAEGKSQDQAAHDLGWSRGTLKRRLERGREILRGRLSRRGFALSAAVAIGLTPADLLAIVPPTLMATTVKLAALSTAPEAVVAAAVSAKAALLANGIMKGVFLGKVKVAAAVIMVVGLLGVSAGVVARQTLTQKPAEPAPEAQAHEAAPLRQGVPAAAKRDTDGELLPDFAIARLGTNRWRHGGGTTALAFAPDGKSLFTMGHDGLRLWEVATGKPLHRLANQDDRYLNPGILSADGKQVITVNIDQKGRLRLWDVASGRLVRELGDHGCIAGCFSPDQRILATLGTSQPFDPRVRDSANVISLWDLATGQRLNAWTGHQDGVYCGVFTADGKTLITGGGDNVIRFWDAASGREVRQLDGGPAALGYFALSPDGKLLAAINLRGKKPAGGLFPSGLAWHADDSIRIWDLATGKEIQHLTLTRPEERGNRGFTALAFAPDGKTIITGCLDRFARVWDVATGKELRRYDFGHPVALALSPDGKILAGLPGSGTTVRLIDMTSGEELCPPMGHISAVRWTSLTPDNKTAITAAGEGPILLWDVATGQERYRLEGQKPYLAGVLAAGDGRTLYSIGFEDDSIVVWDLTTRKPLRRLAQPAAFKKDPVASALSPEGKTMALAVRTGETFLLDTTTGQETKKLESAPGQVYHLAFIPDGSTLAVFCYDRSVELWDTITGKKLRQMLPPGDMLLRGNTMPSGIDAAALSPDGRIVATVKYNRCPVLFELATGKPLPGEEIKAQGVSVFAFSPDSRMLAWSELFAPAIHLMEVATGKERRRLLGHQGRISSLTFAADGQSLISGSQDTTALVWDLTGRRGGRTAAAQRLPPGTLSGCWADLAHEDPVRAYEAVQRLASLPDQAVYYLKNRLLPVPTADEKRIALLIADLDSNHFKVRERAATELEEMGEGVVAACSAALAGQPSLQVRRGLEAILSRRTEERRHPSPDRLRALRALEALELAGTPEACRFLEALAKGATGAQLTQEASASLARLTRRH